MQVSRALNPRRIARSLVTVLVLTLLETVVAPVLSPIIATPKAEAVTINYSGATTGTDLIIPAGVTSITIEARGAAGGTGGNDGGASGIGSSRVGLASGTFSVSPGDRITIYPGNVGGNGSTSASGAGGAAGGAGLTSIPTSSNTLTPAMTFNGTLRADVYVSGGAGGPAGTGGSSGGGGGGGAASLVMINAEVAVVAGGGGGGAGGSGATATAWDENYVSTGSPLGGNGVDGGTCGNTDGGGSGGGGGGWFGGAAGAVTRPAGGECRGYSGSSGTNFLSSRATSTASGLTTANGAGAVTYTLNYAATSACATNSTVVDIYTVVKVTTTANCTWTVPSSVSVIDLFLVGGGGGGAGDGGPGGNGGAAVSRNAVAVVPNSTMTLKTGYGGAATSWSYYSASAAPGDSTTVVTSTGTVYYAPGGTASSSGPSSGVAAAPSIPNGGFAGGLGGAGYGATGSGLPGKTGISNYFYGTQNTYAGGGGGGVFSGASCSTAYAAGAGANGGGNGSSVSGGSVFVGGNGTDGTGGGGGGGLASAGCGPRVIGGKGGSGVILIRYATNSADAFPSSLTSAVAARYSPADMQVLDSGRKGWIDSSGKNASVPNSNFTGSPTIGTRGTTDGANSTNSSKTLLVAKGGTGDKIFLSDLPNNYTLFHLARYVTGGTTGRLITESGGNWISGHYNGTNGCAHHATWLTGSGCNTNGVYAWQLVTDQIKYFRNNGVDVTMNQDANNGSGHYYLYNQINYSGFGINVDPYGQQSTWEVAELLFFNRQLTSGEIRAVENWLARVNGLTLGDDYVSSETDTAGQFDNKYYYGQYLNGMYLNDTFTIESWVKPAAYCNSTTECALFSYENVLVFRIYNGTLHYALYGSVSGWVWTNTFVKLPADEWHHFAFSKRLTGNKANAVDVYLDGQLAYTNTGSPYLNDTGNVAATNSNTDVVNTNDTWYYIGARTNGTRYYGAADEFKVWKVARTGAEILADMNSNDPTSPNLQLYYDFNRDTLSNGFDLINLAYGGPSRADMVASTTMNFEDVKTVAKSGPYTTIKFPRSYITQKGGWKVPANLTTATSIVVGGGGGGGYGGASNAPAGGGGGGGVTASLTQSFTPNATVQVQVGQGGLGGFALSDASVRNGQSSILGVAGNLTALGGGGGGNAGGGATKDGAGGSSVATGGGSGNSAYTCSGSPLTPSGTFFPGATVPSGNNGGGGIWGWGGAGGGARGAATNGVCAGPNAGTPGPGYFDPITNIEYGRGGGSDAYTSVSAIAGNTTQNNGWGGIVSYNGGNASGVGYRGSSGTIVIRYITAAKPTFTSPTNAYLNVGMTETFTTLVSADSATVGLTRTFRWESTTAGAGGTYSQIKNGTGAANAAYSWIPSDTSTSGSQYLYRVVVTDSDTAGLFIQDTSTPVFAVINGTLRMSGVTSIKKTINIARNETFTISAGTPTYRYTLTPTIPGITLDTSTVGTTLLKISDSAAVGTFMETLTVTDSVSASVQIPISINISAPPTLVNGGEIISNGQIFNFDPGISASYNIATGVASDISGTRKAILIPNGATYSNDFSGILSFASGSSQYMSATAFTQYNTWSIEAWIRLDASVAHFCPLTSEYNPTNISFALCIDAGRTIYAGFHNGSWTYKRSNELVPIGTWTLLTATFDGAAMNVYINGVPITIKDQATASGLIPPQPSTNRIFINKDYSTAVGTTASASYGSLRMYNVGLSQSDVVKNYNATKNRFATVNQNQLKVAQKYGLVTPESFTITAGGETETVSFAVGNRSGVLWDTATVGVIKLSVQESLTPGTYYDTITVTDNFASSTTLPIRFTVSKADTLTVYVDTPTALSYTGSQARFTSTLKSIGAVGLETGTTFSATVKFKPGGSTCATGGYCRVGDIGPAGGVIFIDTSTASSDGRIYEAAPQNWSGSDDLATVAQFCTGGAAASANIANGSQVGIGWGDTLTANFDAGCSGGAVQVAADLVLNGYSDWFVPSENEAVRLYSNRDSVGLIQLGANWSTGNWGYWTSTESSAGVMRIISNAGSWSIGNGNKNEATKLMLRPVRAFKSCWAIDTCTALATTDTPTASGVYQIVPSALTNISDLLTKYSNVVYLPTNLTINKIAPTPIAIPWINTNYPDTFTINFTAATGNQVVRYSTTNGTASGCALDYRKVYTTSQGTCMVTITRAADRNYTADTTTATVFFLTFVNAQPTNQVGSGSGIALNGVTSFSIDTTAPPKITGISWVDGYRLMDPAIGFMNVQAHYEITGSGFGSVDNTDVTIKFWRNKSVSTGTSATAAFVAHDGLILILTMPTGVTAGRFAVITPNGEAVSDFTFTP